MVEALLDHLNEKPELYLEEMAWFIRDEFKEVVQRAPFQEPWQTLDGQI
jgi:hypothetical protein